MNRSKLLEKDDSISSISSMSTVDESYSVVLGALFDIVKDS